MSSVTTSLDFDAIAAGGDSLLQGSGLHVQLESSDGHSLHAARIVPNRSGRLAQIRLTVTADDFSSAENEAFDAVMPTLSRIAFQADTPLEVTAISLTERATQTRQLRTTLVGAVQPAPEIAETTTPELRMFLAAYREGLNGNSPLYQALSFYKILEGATKFHANTVRAAKKRGEAAPADPMARQIPVDPDGLADVTVWSRGNFMPYLGKSFAEIRDAVTDTIRHEELASLSGADPSASSPAA
ncbi:methylamine utilization protein MauJ [Trebonia sp.]|uniref:methylamine utilization protein MauJ n=1 Tax=Trebonia sp. TaxID=2767075 RepID=UPI003BB0ED3C